MIRQYHCRSGVSRPGQRFRYLFPSSGLSGYPRRSGRGCLSGRLQSVAGIFKNYVSSDALICGRTDCFHCSVCIQRSDVASRCELGSEHDDAFLRSCYPERTVLHQLPGTDGRKSAGHAPYGHPVSVLPETVH